MGKTLYCVSIFTHSQSHTITHSLSLVLVAVMKSKELKNQISHTDSLILTLVTFGIGFCSSASLTHSLSLVLVVMMRSKELKTSRSILMLIL